MRDDGVEFNTFDWDRWEGTAVARIAEYVLAWALKALREEQYSRGDYRYSLEITIIFLGGRVDGFLIRRVFKVLSCSILVVSSLLFFQVQFCRVYFLFFFGGGLF